MTLSSKTLRPRSVEGSARVRLSSDTPKREVLLRKESSRQRCYIFIYVVFWWSSFGLLTSIARGERNILNNGIITLRERKQTNTLEIRKGRHDHLKLACVLAWAHNCNRTSAFTAILRLSINRGRDNKKERERQKEKTKQTKKERRMNPYFLIGFCIVLLSQLPPSASFIFYFIKYMPMASRDLWPQYT